MDSCKKEQDWRQRLVASQIWPTCLNCEKLIQRYNTQTGIDESVCVLAGTTPPPHVVLYACPSWVGDVPF